MKMTIVIILIAFIGVLAFLLSIIYKNPDSLILKTLCKGSARCFEGMVEDVIDGDTLEVNDETVRLALINTPEKWEDDYEAAVDFVWDLCPIGSGVVVDEDDLQTSRSHRRMIGTVYCESENRFKNLNEALLEAGHAEIIEDFCKKSEFSDEEWAISYGCA